jgi:hypothetical protein
MEININAVLGVKSLSQVHSRVSSRRNEATKQGTQRQSNSQPVSTEKECKKKLYLEGKHATEAEGKMQCVVRRESFVENWIQCPSCKGWNYENCTEL